MTEQDPQPLRVEIRNLTKAFALRKSRKAKGVSLDRVDSLQGLLSAVFRPGRLRSRLEQRDDEFLYAIDDVSLTVEPGEILGVIGRNGAGKSTLLKVLGRVLEPTGGQVRLRGRVVSLLELGVGFAADLTVRENLRLYARLANIPPAVLRRHEDEILDFAKLTDYCDLPLGHCPSGSFIQLAFAATTMLDADIILADEVLAVGDKEFRAACEARILELQRNGRTVLFVSHDMNAIRRLCTRVLWLDHGRMKMCGDTEEVVSRYLSDLLAGRLLEHDSSGSGADLLDLRLLDAEGGQVGAMQITAANAIGCLFRVTRPDAIVNLELELFVGKHVVSRTRPPRAFTPGKTGTFQATLHIPPNMLNELTYNATVRLYVTSRGTDGNVEECVGRQTLEFVVMNPHAERSVWSDWIWGRPGFVSPAIEWRWDGAPATPATPTALPAPEACARP